MIDKVVRFFVAYLAATALRKSAVETPFLFMAQENHLDRNAVNEKNNKKKLEYLKQNTFNSSYII